MSDSATIEGGCKVKGIDIVRYRGSEERSVGLSLCRLDCSAVSLVRGSDRQNDLLTSDANVTRE